jgi:hypothetical protein
MTSLKAEHQRPAGEADAVIPGLATGLLLYQPQNSPDNDLESGRNFGNW